MRAPRVFISYAHESDEHAEAVRDLWVFLRANGVDARLDRVAAQRRQDWTLWMEEQVDAADHILVIASPAYRRRAGPGADPGEGRGVQYEARLLRNLFYQHQQDLDRFLPVVLPGGSAEDLPGFLTPAIATVYRVTGFTVAGAEPLLRLLLGMAAEVEPGLGKRPDLPARGVGAALLRHEIRVEVTGSGSREVAASTSLAGTLLGQHAGVLPFDLPHCWDNLDTPGAVDRLAAAGVGLWQALFDEATTGQLLALIDRSPVGTPVDVVVSLAQPLAWLPVELLRLPEDRRLLATIAGVRVTRRLAGVDRAPVGPLPGPLKILAAVAAPEETQTGNGPVDVEAEMQALLDAVTDTAAGDQAQVRILEVASLAEITAALRADQFHVLHLFAHGSQDGIELEDEDGRADFAPTSRLLAALKAGGHLLPLVVLSSCSGAAGGTSGLAAALVTAGADRVLGMHTSVTDTYATALGRGLYRALATDPTATVADAVAPARHDIEQQHAAARARGEQVRPESAVATLLAAGPDTPLRRPPRPRGAAGPRRGPTSRDGGAGAAVGSVDRAPRPPPRHHRRPARHPA